MTLKGLVQQSPVRWPDGTFFIGNKVTDFYALDLASGKVVYRYEHGPGLTCPSEEVARAFTGDSPTLLLIAKSIYTLACFGPSSDSISPSWNITYAEFGGFIDPFREMAFIDTRRPSSSIPLEDEIEIYSSFSGMVIARDTKTKQLMWARKLRHTATAFFSLASPQDSGDGERDILGPILRSIPIKAVPLFSSSSASLIDPSVEMMVNLGSIEGTLYALGSDRFPVYQNVPFGNEGEGGTNTKIGGIGAATSDKPELAPLAETDIITTPCPAILDSQLLRTTSWGANSWLFGLLTRSLLLHPHVFIIAIVNATDRLPLHGLPPKGARPEPAGLVANLIVLSELNLIPALPWVPIGT